MTNRERERKGLLPYGKCHHYFPKEVCVGKERKLVRIIGGGNTERGGEGIKRMIPKTVSKGKVISKGESNWRGAKKYPLDLAFESSKISGKCKGRW